MLKSDLGLIMDVDNTEYNRYRDTVSDEKWQTEFDYGVERDNKEDEKWQTQFDYGVERDKVADNMWQTEFDWNKYVDDWTMKNTETVQAIEQALTKWQTTGVADEEVSKILGVPVGTSTESHEYNEWTKRNAEATQSFEQALTKWNMTGVADESVANALGVPVGATTESYYFKKASQALEQNKFNAEQKAAKDASDKAAEEQQYIDDSVISGAKTLRNAPDGEARAANYVLSQASSASDYYRLGQAAGIPRSVLDSVISTSIYEASNQSAGENTKDYNFYAEQMGMAEDPEAWLMQNMYYIPADIVKDLSELLKIQQGY
jgi:hypothetical protein